MKKHILYLFLISLAFTSCEDDEGSDVAIQSYSPITINLSLSDNNVTISENAIAGGHQDYTVTATLSEAQTLDYVVNFEQVGGNADENDYETHNIIIRAGATSGTSDISILQTGDIEGNESVTITATTFKTAKLSGDVVFKANIVDDYVNDVVKTSATWAGSYDYTVTGAAVSVDYCDIDLDVLLLDGSFGFVGYLGATGSCTETGEISGLADGTYYIAIDVYDNPIAQFGTNQPLPITFTYSQEHFDTSGSFVIGGFTTDSSPGTFLVAQVDVVNGYMYTIAPL